MNSDDDKLPGVQLSSATATVGRPRASELFIRNLNQSSKGQTSETDNSIHLYSVLHGPPA